jgi:AmmeMemoRadiSam system protein A
VLRRWNEDLVAAFPLVPDPPRLSREAERVLGRLAAEAIAAYCLRRDPGLVEDAVGLALHDLSLRTGVFVTLYEAGELRGCLGSAEGREPLQEAVPRLAVAAASRDVRFQPVELEALGRLRIEITLLGSLVRLPCEQTTLLRGLDTRRHGVTIRKGDLTGLYLPQVARRLGWGARELLAEVSLKAGLAEDAWREPEAEIYAFTAWSFRVPVGP